jgi:imidazolonepropionase-like amidohydrolase
MKYLFIFLAFASCATQSNNDNDTILLKNANVITGDGSQPAANTDILIRGGEIAEIGKNINDPAATVVDVAGKTVMPALISAHVHVGVLKGTTSSGTNYTRENVLDQLKKYADYGVLNLQVMGTDRPVLFQNGLYDSIQKGLLPGARMLSAGYGFNVPQANVDPASMMGNLYRPASAEAVPKEMDSIAALNIRIVKIWVDDMGGTAKKMDPSVYQAIIKEAHQRNIRVAAHLYYLDDARKLVNAGLDIIAHSIRDSVVDDAFVQSMKAHNVVYIPTLSLDKFNYAYSEDPDWVNDPFFKASLEPGVYEMITSEKFKTEQKNSPALARNRHAFEIAMQNVKKISDGGVPVALGTDSGAFPVRAQGYSEHLELQLMTEAGLTPLQAITAGTKNSAAALHIDDRFGTIQKGKVADLLVLDGDPSADIKNSRKIDAVYKAGQKIR